MTGLENYHFGQEMQHREYHPTDLDFEKHIHRSFELWFCEYGEFQISIDDHIYTLKPNQMLLILPFQSHGVQSFVKNQGHIWIFSPEYIVDFFQQVQGKKFAYPIIQLSENDVSDLMDKLFQNDSIFSHKWALYQILSLYEKHTDLIDSQLKDSITEKIASWFSENFDKNKTLSDLSEDIGYSNDYLSKIISSTFESNFSHIMNQHRINRACYLLSNSSYPITEISNLAGFQNVRTFNRNFSKMMDITPREYRNSTFNLEHTNSKTDFYTEAFLRTNQIKRK